MTRTAAAALALMAWPAGLLAQAVCSAPHSSPVLASGQGLQTLAPGTGWIQLSALRQVSDRYFGAAGERQPFLAAGEVSTSSLYLTGALGLVRGIDAWGQIPVHDVKYADQSGARAGSGLGDPRLSIRVGAAFFGADAPLALRAGVKLPGRQFPVDATIIPLSEGQRDWEVSLESGAVWHRMPLYLLGWIGYRWRQVNAAVNRKPGNERFAHLAAGGRLGAIQAEAGIELLTGDAPQYLGVEVSTATRRLVQLQPTLAFPAGPGAIELTALIPLGGRNLPAGPGLSAGYRLAWGSP